jgi:hypothetical protein
MQLIFQDDTSHFQQAIYSDEETGLLYELIRIRGEGSVEVYVGSSEDGPLDYWNDDGVPVSVQRSVTDDTSMCFPIRKGEPWKTLVARLPGYLIRMQL